MYPQNVAFDWKMKTKFNIVFFITLIATAKVVYAQDSLMSRAFHFSYYNQFDLRNSSTNAISTHRMLHDVFRKGIHRKMNGRWGTISYGLFSFTTTYLTMLWSHEFGHSLRAKQVGGHFNIHNFGLPIPYTTMHLPESISLIDEALSVTAGFEVNTLNIRALQKDFIVGNGICNEDLALSFANRIMYPLYSSVIVPRDPKDKDVWINTAGDPIHIALAVFKNYSGGQLFMPDSTVNPQLVRYYNQSSIFALLINLTDPHFYKEVAAAFGRKKLRTPVFLIGDHTNGWTYGTLFNTSPLGYELYLNNYIQISNRTFSVYFKYGNPFKNNGLGLNWYNIIGNKRIHLSAGIDVWDQDLFGKGLSGEVSTEIKISDHFGISSSMGYKTKGYVLGKQIQEGLNLGVGIQIHSKY